VTTATGHRVRRIDRVGPLVVTGLAVVGVGLLSVRNPNVAGSYGACPFRAVTGWDCPFCGGLRGTYSLLHADVPTALDHNILLPLLLGAGVLGLVAWWRSSGHGRSGSGRSGHGQDARAAAAWPSWVGSRAVVLTAALVLASFWVIRNIPAFSYLDSAAT